MEINEDQVLTPEGKEKLENELEVLIRVEKPKNQEELALARSQGDLSENADYDAARDKQAQIEARINEIKYQLDHFKTDKNIVNIGSTITILRLDNNKSIVFKIGGSTETDLKATPIVIANTSPMGSAVIGKKVNDVCRVIAPKEFSVKIIKIA